MVIQNFQEAYRIYYTNVKNEFEFFTDNGIKYVIYASASEKYLKSFKHFSRVFYVGFHPHRETNFYGDEKKSDKKIMNTVLNFLFGIFSDEDSIIVFNYSAAEGKDEERKRLFNIQYIRHNHKRFHKMDIGLEGDDILTLVFRKDNINFAEICTMTAKDIFLSK